MARKFLKRRGLKILARNFRCPRGEVDLIALDASTRREGGAETICFVEVKTRSSDRYTDPESAVDADKQKRVRKAADYYLAKRAAAADGLNVRFDILSIVIRDRDEPRIRHIQDAF
jgi:putative endonuclease